MNQQYIVFPGIFNHLFEEFKVNHFGCRIVRMADDDDFWSGPGLFGGVDEVIKKILIRPHGDSAYIPTGYDGRIRMYRIGRIRGEDHITGANGDQNKMGQALLDTDGHDSLCVGIYLNIKTPLIPVGNG